MLNAPELRAPTLPPVQPKAQPPAHSKAQPPVQPGVHARVRVLVVDDSVVIRRFVSRVITEDPALELAGFAANGTAALTQAALLEPDVITMDIEMPEMNGLEAVRALRSRGSKAVIIMCSTLTARGASSTIEALMLGANDYVTKPSGSDSMDAALEAMRQELLPKIKQFFRPALKPAVPQSVQPREPARVAGRTESSRFTPEQRKVLAIGVSTGGPTALMDLLPRLPANFPLPIVIVQHMPPMFTRQLAERLHAESRIAVAEAAEGMPLLPGNAVIAPGDYHLRLKRVGDQVRVALDQGERENSCRPAVDVLFRSVLQVYGGRALGLVLTGMGQDGLRGSEELKKEGACILVQDRQSSVVWGMPGAVAEAQLADEILSLRDLPAAILRRVPAV